MVFRHLYKDKTIAWLAPVIYCHRVRPLRNSENFRTNFQNYLTFESLFNDDDVIARIIFQRRTVLQQYFRMLQNDLLVYSNMKTIWMAKGILWPTLTVLHFLLFFAPEANIWEWHEKSIHYQKIRFLTKSWKTFFVFLPCLWVWEDFRCSEKWQMLKYATQLFLPLQKNHKSIFFISWACL